MNVHGACHELLAYDYMYGRNVTGITDWKRQDVVIDMPNDSTDIEFGITMVGKGEIWASGVAFEETTDDTTGMKTYEDEPQNLDFSE